MSATFVKVNAQGMSFGRGKLDGGYYDMGTVVSLKELQGWGYAMDSYREAIAKKVILEVDEDAFDEYNGTLEAKLEASLEDLAEGDDDDDGGPGDDEGETKMLNGEWLSMNEWWKAYKRNNKTCPRGCGQTYRSKLDAFNCDCD